MLDKTKLLLSCLLLLACNSIGFCQFKPKAQVVFLAYNQLNNLVNVQKYQDGFVLFWNVYQTKGDNKLKKISNATFDHIQLDFFDSRANLTRSLKYESQYKMEISPISYNDIMINNDNIYFMINYERNWTKETYLYCIKDYTSVYEDSISPYQFGQFLSSQNNRIIATCYKETNEPQTPGNGKSPSNSRTYYLMELINNKWKIDKEKQLNLNTLFLKEAFLGATDYVDILNDRLIFYSIYGMGYCSIRKLRVSEVKFNNSMEENIKTFEFEKGNQYINLIKSRNPHEFFMLQGRDKGLSDSVQVYISKIVIDKNEVLLQNEHLLFETNQEDACSIFSFGYIDVFDNNLLIYNNQEFVLYSLQNIKPNNTISSPIIEFLNREKKKEGL